MKEIKKILIFLICIALYHNAMSQNIEFREDNFTDKAGFHKAEKNLINGDKYFQEQKKVFYTRALFYYLKAQEFNPNNSILNFTCLYKSLAVFQLFKLK